MTNICCLALVLICFIVTSNGYGQVTAPFYAASGLTNYNNGQTEDSLFVFCAQDPVLLIAQAPDSLTYTFEWYFLDPFSNSWFLVFSESTITSYLANIGGGTYQCRILSDTGDEQWRFNAQVVILQQPAAYFIEPIPSVCGPMTLQASFFPAFVSDYYLPPSSADEGNGSPVSYSIDQGFQWISVPAFIQPNENSANVNLPQNPSVDTYFSLVLTGILSELTCGVEGSEPGFYDFPAVPEISFSALPSLICANQDSLLIVPNIPGGIWSGYGVLDSDNGIFSPSFTGSGYYVLSYTVLIDGCVDQAQLPILVQPLAVPSTSQPGPLCVNSQPVQLSASSPGGIWYGAGIIDSIQGVFSPTAAGVGQHVIYYQIQNVCGGLGQNVYSVAALPEVSIPVQGPFCAETGEVALVADPPQGSWSGPGIGPDGDHINTLNLGPGIYSYIYTYTEGCTRRDTATIQILPQNDAAIAPIFPICINASPVTLSATNPGTWSGNGVNSLGVFNPLVAGPGTSLIVHQTTGLCPDSDTLEIVVLDFASLQLNGPSQICLNAQPIALTSNISGGSWSGQGITNGALGIFNPSIAGIGTHVINYTLPASCGSQSNITIDVKPIPNINLSPEVHICEGSGATINANGGSSYQWTPATGVSDPTISNPFFSPAVSTVYMVQVTNDFGCSNTGTVTVLVESLPVVTIDSVPSVCSIDFVTLHASGLSQYQWSPANYFINPNLASAVATGISEPTVFTVSGTSIYGCYGESSITVNGVDHGTFLGQITVNVPDVICANAGIVELVGTPEYGYWVGTNNDTLRFDPSGMPTFAQLFIFNVDSVCYAKKSFNVNVYAPPAMNGLEDLNVCSGQTVQANVVGADAYSWRPSSGLNNDAIGNPIISVLDTTTYTIVTTYGFICHDTLQLDVIVNPLPTVSINPVDAICRGEAASLNATGLSLYSWTPTTGLSSMSGAQVEATPQDSITYTVSGVDSNGCSGSASVLVPVIVPYLSFGVAPASGFGPLTVDMTGIVTNGTSGTWDMGGLAVYETSNPSQNQQFIFNNPGIYAVNYTIETNGCPFMATQMVEVYRPSELTLIPNIVTNNNDGTNDGFRIYGRWLDNIDVRIYDRWGMEVGAIIRIDQYLDNGWMYSALWRPEEELNDGTYYYVVRATGQDSKPHEAHGSFLMKRKKN